MTNVVRNMQYAYTSDVEDILMLKTFKGLKKQVACETVNRNNYKRYWAQWNSFLVRHNVVEHHYQCSSPEKGGGRYRDGSTEDLREDIWVLTKPEKGTSRQTWTTSPGGRGYTSFLSKQHQWWGMFQRPTSSAALWAQGNCTVTKGGI
jgi:hypothetical protein